MISENGAESAVSSPADQIIGPTTEIPSTVGVHVGLQAVQPSSDHGFDTGQQWHLISSPPHRKPVLSGTITVIIRRHTRPPVRRCKLCESHRPLVKAVPAGISDVFVVVSDRSKINVRAPPSVRQALPIASRVRLIDERRRDGEGPIAVKPPSRQPALHPLSKSLVPEGHLLWRCLQATCIASSNGKWMVIEIGSKTTVS
mmetsp:Transcript_23886/g.57923  ORF Transcript_23886/g.57923 Transcript_23886/m.57923 type:complete len:200 (-) Transcript_23886:1061-1660(-)